MNPTVKSSLLGTLIGAGIGTLPGIFSAVVGSFVTFVRADIGIMNASSVLIYFGILIGGGSGAIVAALTATEEVEEADAVPVARK